MNLVVEYMKRHKTNAIPGCNDTYFFVKNDKNPTSVVLMSNYSRSLTTCPRCGNPDLIVEVVTSSLGFSHPFHFHTEPDKDINQILKSIYFTYPHEAVFIKNLSEIEPWLWSFFKASSCLPMGILKKQNPNAEKTDLYTEMFIVLKNRPDVFRTFYSSLTKIVVGRKYLLIG